MPRRRERSKTFPIEGLLRPQPGVGALTEIPEMFPSPATEFIVKSANETVNNSATLQDDDELLFAVRANETWDLELIILYDTNATADLKWDVFIPGSGTGLGLISRLANGAAGVADDQIGQASQAGTVIGGLGTPAAAHIRLFLTVGDADGNVIFRWAQNAAGASNSVVQAGSYLSARKIS